MRRTLKQVIAEIVRETSGQARPAEAAQGVVDALATIDAKGNWEFQIATVNIGLKAPYSVGTVDLSLGSKAVTGSGGQLWIDSGFDAKRCELVIAGHPPYRIDEFFSNTSLALANFFGGGLPVVPITASAYTIYQAEYVLPPDCEGGRDLVVRASSNFGRSGEIVKKNRAYFERHYDTLMARTSSGAGPWVYTDADNLGDTSHAAIRLYPYPTARSDITVTYYRSLKYQDDPLYRNAYYNVAGVADLDTPVPLPETFNRVVVLLGAAFCMRRRKQQGWLVLYQEAMVTLNDLYARYSVSPAYEDVIDEDMDGPLGPRFGSIESGVGYFPETW